MEAMTLSTGETRNETEFRGRNKSDPPLGYSEQQAEQRSCTEVVGLKVTLRGAKPQEI